MKFRVAPSLLGALAALSATAVEAKNLLQSTSLSTCMENSGFSAKLFNVTFTPDDGQLRIRINGDSKIIGNVRAKVTVLAYGFPVMSQELDPCKTEGLSGMCPMKLNEMDLQFQQTVDKDTVDRIPVIAYKIPDLDGVARMEVLDSTHQRVACVEAPLSNGQTVNQPAVGWVTGVISGLALLASAVVSGLGHSSTAAHLAANALSLFSYFQSQAMVAMVAVPLPPLAAAWAQNFDWAMGIINISFMQRIFHWYIQATNGTPASLFKQQEDVSVQVAKRSLPVYSRAEMYGFSPNPMFKRDLEPRHLAPRSNNDAALLSTTIVKVTGIERMSYIAGIEDTNFFMTGLAFFIAFVCLVILMVATFRALCNLKPIQQKGLFRDFRAKWLVVLKGIMYRVMLIGFPQMATICPWEWVHKDSPAAVSLSVFFFFSMLGTLVWACFKIISIGRHSAALDASRGPAYTLYADPAALNRWGYLYVQFRAERFYYIVPMLVYVLVKGLIIAFGQSSGIGQAFALTVVDLAYLTAVCYLRPWLDRRTNIVNIAIAVVNFLNSVLLIIFSGITRAPDMVPGVLGVAFFVTNAIFALVLLILLVVAVGFAVFSKNPEERYRGDTPLPTTSEKKIIRDLDADTPGSEVDEGISSLHSIPSRNLHSRSESERGTASLRGYDSSPFPRHASPNMIPLPPSTAGSGYEPSMASGRPSLHSQRSRGTGWSAPSAQNYVDREPQRSPVHGHGGRMDWNVGVGFDGR